jgi:hypothetical protein
VGAVPRFAVLGQPGNEVYRNFVRTPDKFVVADEMVEGFSGVGMS